MAERQSPRRSPGGAPRPAEISRSFPAVPQEADRAVEDILQWVQNGDCACGDLDEVRTALREAVNNALRHGCRLDPKKQVHVKVRCDPNEGLELVLRDEGAGFDPSRVPDPTRPENLERFSGRGLYMIRKLMDEVEFGDRGREIRMRRRPR